MRCLFLFFVVLLGGFNLIAAAEVEGTIAEIKSTFCKVNVPSVLGIAKGDVGKLSRTSDVSFSATVIVTAVKPTFLVVKFDGIDPHVGDAVLFSIADDENPVQPGDVVSADFAKLEAAAGKTVSVTLQTGKVFENATLIRTEKTRDIISKIRVEHGSRKLTFGIKSILKIEHERMVLYEVAKDASVKPVRKTKLQLREEKAAQQRVQAEKEWLALVKKTGVKPWEIPSEAEEAKALDSHRERIKAIQKRNPSLRLHETESFLFLTNIPQPQAAPYVANLDAMHKMLMQMYQISDENRVWLGKALVVAFITQNEFIRFEAEFMNNVPGPRTYGLCHSRSDGDVVVSCFRGNNPADFAHMLVHETSHGFLHRYKTPVRFPSWVNEGLADYVGQKVVPAGRSVAASQKAELKQVALTRSLGGVVREDSLGQAFSGYGIASAVVTFMIKTDDAKFASFIDNLKGGMAYEESLMQSYGVTPQQLITAFGRSVGMPNLRP